MLTIKKDSVKYRDPDSGQFLPAGMIETVVYTGESAPSQTIEIDTTLTTAGAAADAKATGDALSKKITMPAGGAEGQILVKTSNGDMEWANQPETIKLDTTLKEAGKAADAKTTGDALNELKNDKVDNSGWTAGKNVVTDEDGKITTEDKPISLPSGGTAGQVLAKKTDTNGDTEWSDPPSGGADPLTIYPVGSIYMSANETSPAALFGGTWEQLKDRFLLGAGGEYSLGDTGGEAEHTLTVAELPDVNVNVQAFSVSSGGTDTSDYPASTINIVQYYPDGVPTGVSYITNLFKYKLGYGESMNIMNPYLAVNIWKRVA